MVTSLNRSVPARDAGYQGVQYLRKAILPGIPGTAQTIGVLPANAQIIPGSVLSISTLFNGTTPNLDIGYAADSLGVADPKAYGSAIVLTATGVLALDELAAATSLPRNGETTVTATVTGAGNTTGAAEVIIPYTTKNPPS
jgi:hypothetical protein